MRAERPSQIVRCELLAAWRGLDLVARDGAWDLVERPSASGRRDLTGRTRASGLSLAEVEAFLAEPAPPLPSDPRVRLLHEVVAHLEAAERQAMLAPPGPRRRGAEEVIDRLTWFHGELASGRGDGVATGTLQRILGELVVPLLPGDQDR